MPGNNKKVVKKKVGKKKVVKKADTSQQPVHSQQPIQLQQPTQMVIEVSNEEIEEINARHAKLEIEELIEKIRKTTLKLNENLQQVQTRDNQKKSEQYKKIIEDAVSKLVKCDMNTLFQSSEIEGANLAGPEDAQYPVLYFFLSEEYFYAFNVILNKMKANLKLGETLGNKLNEMANPKQCTILNYVCAMREIDFVKTLIAEKVDVNKVADNGESAIMAACIASVNDAFETQLSIIKLLIDAGADLKYITKEQKTTLTYAASFKNQRKEVIELLLKEQDVKNAIDHEDIDGNTAFSYACGLNIEIVKILINSDMDLSNRNNGLQIACQTGNTEIAQLLINKGIDVNFVSKNGNTALISCFVYLMEPLFDPSSEDAISEEFKLKQANELKAREANLNMLILITKLISTISDKDKLIQTEKRKKYVNHKDGQGNTAIIYAFNVENRKLIEILLSYGADLDCRDNNGVTPLMRMCASQNTELVEYLIEYITTNKPKLDLDLQDENGDTALITAAKNGHAAIVSLLLNEGASVNLQDSQGKTALHAAISAFTPENSMEMLKLVNSLLEKGADSFTVISKACEINEPNELTIIDHLIKGKKINARAILKQAWDKSDVKVILFLIGYSLIDPDKVLLQACNENKLDLIRQAIQNATGIKLGKKNITKILNHACKKGSIEVVEAILNEKNFDVIIGTKATEINSTYSTALYNACKDNRSEIAKSLLTKCQHSKGNMDDIVTESLKIAITNGHSEIVGLIFTYPLSTKEELIKTAVQQACTQQQMDILSCLMAVLP